jgi:hypothetical protein
MAWMQRRDRTPAVPRLARGWATALLGFVVLLAVTTYYPFDWDPPRTVRNDVTRTADGALRFGESNTANSQGTPAFVVSDVFHARRWTRLRLRMEGANLRIDVDSTMRFLEPVPKGSLRQWGDARIALGGKPRRRRCLAGRDP